MGFSVAVWGKLDLRAKDLTAWRRARVDAARWSDWTGDFAAPFRREPTTVAAHLARYADDDAVEVRVKKTSVTWRGLLDEDTYRSDCAEFRAAAEHGGKGELIFAGVGEDIACVVSVGEGSSRFSDVPMRSEWRATIEDLMGRGRECFDDTTVGKTLRDVEQAAKVQARALRTATESALAKGPLDDGALTALFHALTLMNERYPTMEPMATAHRCLLDLDDARVGPWAIERLHSSSKDLSVKAGLLSSNLIALVVRHQCREARGLLATIHGADDAARFVRIVAARAVLELATDDEIRAVFNESRETVADSWAKPNAKIEQTRLSKLAAAS